MARKKGEPSPGKCSSCGKTLGTTGGCKKCHAHLLEVQGKKLSRKDAKASAESARAFVADPPWYARFAPQKLFRQLKLLLMMVEDYFRGDYKDVPWRTIAMIIVAIAYIVSPLDLIPDFLIPVGWTDDVVVAAVTFASLEVDLKKYAKWKGLDPREYGF